MSDYGVDAKTRQQVEIEMRDKRTEGDLRRRGMSEEDIRRHMKWVRDNRD